MLIVIFAGKLVEQGKHSDAATVLEQYAQVNSVPSFLNPADKPELLGCTLLIMKVKGTVGN